eukprot:NODE_231_length_1777_cov_238.239837.p1 GENE.NODE_231_length_1777_cov_238.239837~~NODE_231_length_1777_cov_238.239837.p1  ORF type:complete len:540 (+),score=127.57 NODE_231_length_1777_cov_238.239837:3-1622(+)
MGRALLSSPLELTVFADLLFLFLYILLLLLFAGRRVLTPRKLDAFYSALMLTIIVAILLGTDFHQSASQQGFAMIYRMSFSVFNLNVAASLFWNLVMAVTLTVASVVGDGVNAACTQTPSTTLTLELTNAIIISLCVFLVRLLVKTEARLDLRAMSSKQELRAFRSLLGTLCDAVVELDADYRFRQHSPQLAMLLTRGAQASSLEGTEFSTLLLSSEDREVFERHVDGIDAGEPMFADACHLRLRGSLGEGVHVEVLHVRSLDEDQRPVHLAGIREFTDMTALTRGQSPSVAEPGLPEALTITEQSRDIASSGCARAGALEGCTSDAMAISCDAFSLTILDCSEPLCTLLGHAPLGTSLLSMLRANPPALLERFQEHVNIVVNSDVTSAVVDLGLVHFRVKPPQSRSRLKISAYCRANVIATDDSESTVPADAHEEVRNSLASAPVIAVLELRDLHDIQRGFHRLARSTTSSSGSGGAGAGATGSGGGAATRVGACGVGADGSTGAGIGARASTDTSRSAVVVGKGSDSGGTSDGEESL